MIERDLADRLEHGLDAQRGVERGAQRVELAVDRVRGDLGGGAELVLALAPDGVDALRVPRRGLDVERERDQARPVELGELGGVGVLPAQAALEVGLRGVALGAQALHVAGLRAGLLVELRAAVGELGEGGVERLGVLEHVVALGAGA